MHKGRFEAFTDAVIAIIMTIMVLELRPPADASLRALVPLQHELLAYVLSFVNLGIYWNNHHHMMQSAKQVNGGVLWANLHLLFWLSLIPFTTAWLGGMQGVSRDPAIAYGIVLLGAAFGYLFLTMTLIRANGRDSELAAAIGRDFKGKISIVIYAVGIGFAWVSPIVSCILYAAVALMWLVPDRRFERSSNKSATP